MSEITTYQTVSLVKGTTSIETSHAEGNIASFTTPVSNEPLTACSADINAEQDLNGYDNPWPGGGGKNKCPNTFNGSYSGITYEALDNGKVHASGTVTSASWQNLTNIFSLSECGLNVGDTVTISSGIRAIAQFKDAGNTTLASCDSRAAKTVTVPQDAVSVHAILYAKASVGVVGETIDEELWAQLEIGTSITSFVPFENICPITGWTDCEVTQTGFNQWDEEWEIGNINANTGANSVSTLRMRSKNYIPVLGGTAYYLKCDTSVYNSWFLWFLYDANKNYLGYITPTNNGQTTLSQNVRYIRFATSDVWNAQDYTSGICINISSDRNGEYEPYNGTTYSTSLGSTVYGGTLDIVSGVLTVDKVSITYDGSGDENWLSNGSYGTAIQVDGYASVYSTNKYTALGNGSGSGLHNGQVRLNTAKTALLVQDARAMKIVDFVPLLQMEPLQVVYELATPTTTTLTPQEVNSLLGENNIWADTGDVEVEYVSSIKNPPHIYTGDLSGASDFIKNRANQDVDDLPHLVGISSVQNMRGKTNE